MNGPGSVIPAEAMSRFSAAEGRLYPMAIVDPAGYETAATLVGIVARELRQTCGDVAAVLHARDDLIARLPHLAEAAHLTPAVPAADVVDAASALRCRELQAAETVARHEARVLAARAAGEEWLIDEADPDAVMAGSYRRVERHLPSGTALIMSMEAGTGETDYTIEISADDDDDARPDVRSYPDRDAWLAATAQLRADLQDG